MSKLDEIKNKIRSSGGTSVHAQLIDTDFNADDKKVITGGYVNTSENDSSNTVSRVEPISRKPAPEERQKRKPKFEDLYRRDTFWIRNDLKDKLDFLSGEKGEKTRIVNEALEMYFNKRK